MKSIKTKDWEIIESKMQELGITEDMPQNTTAKGLEQKTDYYASCELVATVVLVGSFSGEESYEIWFN